MCDFKKLTGIIAIWKMALDQHIRLLDTTARNDDSLTIS